MLFAYFTVQVFTAILAEGPRHRLSGTQLGQVFGESAFGRTESTCCVACVCFAGFLLNHSWRVDDWVMDRWLWKRHINSNVDSLN